MAADVVKVTQNGLALFVNRILGSGVAPSYVHWGTGTTAATNANTVLETPRSEARSNGALTAQTTTYTGDTLQNVATLTCASTSAQITEMGIFDASTAGNLVLRATFDPISLNPADSIAFTTKIQFTST